MDFVYYMAKECDIEHVTKKKACFYKHTWPIQTTWDTWQVYKYSTYGSLGSGFTTCVLLAIVVFCT